MILCFRESCGTHLLRIGQYCNIIIRLFAFTRLARITHWAKYVALCQARPRLLGEIKNNTKMWARFKLSYRCAEKQIQISTIPAKKGVFCIFFHSFVARWVGQFEFQFILGPSTPSLSLSLSVSSLLVSTPHYCNAYGTNDRATTRGFFMVNCETFIYLLWFLLLLWSGSGPSAQPLFRGCATACIHNILLVMHRLIALNSQLGAHKPKKRRTKKIACAWKQS